ncbi:MAG: 1-deoxy-D-xylulose-5-phosphate reductoisomerase [Thermodesulfovibrio sp.]|nr:1-deoxy-D-xylulose-5-phosphate reductoisomerase [Thermodesulfovibrio sp.]
MKNIAILGSTGSIGRSALSVISMFPDTFKVVGLTAGKNISLLMEQIKLFKPKVVAVGDRETYTKLKDAMDSLQSPDMLYGTEGLSNVASMPDADTVISAIVGSAGLIPTISAITAGKTVALANKETLVMAGNIVMSEISKYGVTLLPVDSEHSAVFQCIKGYNKSSVKRIILTASGGPFLGKKTKELENIMPEDALRHPNWSMGKKITIDSSTLMNKGLEVIEAHYLFDMPMDRIDVLIHPQSLIHSIVEFNDGSYIAQMSKPDMKGPIAFSLSCPERLQDVVEPIEWEKLSGLTFQKPDTETFPCLSLAYSAIETGGTMPAVLNASNEVAVHAFLNGLIGFNDIPVVIRKVMDSHVVQPADDIHIIIEADRWARDTIREDLHR